MILHYFKKKENTEKKIAKDIYYNILRNAELLLVENKYIKEKNYNSSFEIVSLFLIVYFKLNIENKVSNYKQINEELMKLFVSDLDESLRSKGIGDMSIGKYVKSYVKKFYFRLSRFPNRVNDLNEKIFEEYLQKFDFIKDGQGSKASKKFLDVFRKILLSYK